MRRTIGAGQHDRWEENQLRLLPWVGSFSVPSLFMVLWTHIHQKSVTGFLPVGRKNNNKKNRFKLKPSRKSENRLGLWTSCFKLPCLFSLRCFCSDFGSCPGRRRHRGPWRGFAED